MFDTHLECTYIAQTQYAATKDSAYSGNIERSWKLHDGQAGLIDNSKASRRKRSRFLARLELRFQRARICLLPPKTYSGNLCTTFQREAIARHCAHRWDSARPTEGPSYDLLFIDQASTASTSTLTASLKLATSNLAAG